MATVSAAVMEVCAVCVLCVYSLGSSVCCVCAVWAPEVPADPGAEAAAPPAVDLTGCVRLLVLWQFSTEDFHPHVFTCVLAYFQLQMS